MRNAQTFLRMETPPLRLGMCPFANGNATFVGGGAPVMDGNAAARTFGRAHRRRPYHFSCGSVSQGCRRGARRWTKTRKGCWRGARRRYSALFIAGKVLAADILRCLSQENSSPPIFRAVYRRKTVRRRYSALFIAGKVLAADILHCLSQEKSSPPIFRAVYRRKTVRRRYSVLFIAGKEFADGLIRKKVGGKGLNGGITR